MNCQGMKRFFVVLAMSSVLYLPGCGLSESSDRSQLLVAQPTQSSTYVLECTLHLIKDGSSLHRSVQRSTRFANEDEARRSIPFYTQALEQSCEDKLHKDHQEASALCRGLRGASRTVLCSTSSI